jgi:hypothetical protein
VPPPVLPSRRSPRRRSDGLSATEHDARSMLDLVNASSDLITILLAMSEFKSTSAFCSPYDINRAFIHLNGLTLFDIIENI